MSDNILVYFPDGEELRWSFPIRQWSEGQQCPTTKRKESVFLPVVQANRRAKKKSTQVQLLSNISSRSPYRFIFLDFDRTECTDFCCSGLEEGKRFRYCTGHVIPAPVIKHLKTEQYVVFKTLNNNEKILLMIRPGVSVNPNPQDVCGYVRQLFPKTVMRLLDKSYSALFSAGVTPDSIKRLTAFVDTFQQQTVSPSPSSPPSLLVHDDKAKGIDKHGQFIYRYTYRRSLRGLHPDLLKWVKSNANDNRREQLMRLLLSLPGLAKETGYQLPQKTIATQCTTDQQTISRLLRELTRLGFLECVNERYKVGQRAKAFRSRGHLRTFQLEVIAKSQVRNARKDVALPGAVEPGSWDTALFRAALYVKGDEARYWEWFNRLDGHMDGNRQSKASHALKCAKKGRASNSGAMNA
jgi:hypothetical protein